MKHDDILKIERDIEEIAWQASGDDPAVAVENIIALIAGLIASLADSTIGEPVEEVLVRIAQLITEDEDLH